MDLEARRRFEMLNLPRELLQLLVCINADIRTYDPLHCVEYFAGVSAIANAFGVSAYNALSFEKVRPDGSTDDFQDLCSARGFLTALTWLVMTCPEALLWLATVCRTRVVASLSSTNKIYCFFIEI